MKFAGTAVCDDHESTHFVVFRRRPWFFEFRLVDACCRFLCGRLKSTVAEPLVRSVHFARLRC
jgi:hypothetical protein